MSPMGQAGSGSLNEAALAAYLQSHITGSESAEGLAQRLLEGDEHDEDVKRFLKRFVGEIREERGYVESIMERLDRDRSLIRRGLDAATELAGMAGARHDRISRPVRRPRGAGGRRMGEATPVGNA